MYNNSKAPNDNKTRRIFTILISLSLLLVVIINFDPTLFEILKSPHIKTYPSSINFNRLMDKVDMVSYSYSVGDTVYENTQYVYPSYLWINKIFSPNKQNAIIYLRDNPASSWLLLNLYLNFIYDYVMWIALWIILVAIRRIIRKYRNKPTISAAPQSDDVIKRI